MWSRTYTFQLPTVVVVDEVFKVLFQDRQVSAAFCGADHVENPVPCVGGLHGSRPGRVSSASSSHSPGGFYWSFSHFSPT